VIFAWSMLPMLAKAHRTRNLASYSLGNLVLTNVGNAVHSVYVLSLPVGPIWALHGFYLATSWLMLVWCLRYRRLSRSADLPLPPRHSRAAALAGSPSAARLAWGSDKEDASAAGSHDNVIMGA
jgi:hypothetical protein